MAPPATIAGAARPSFSNLPLDAVQEMTVLENDFRPSTAAAPAAPSTSSPRSAGSTLHGDVLELWRPAATEAALSGFTSTNAASGNDITSDTLGQSALRSAVLSGPAYAFLRRGRIQPRGSRLADHLAGRAGQFRRTLSRLAGIPAPGPSDQRSQHAVFPQRIWTGFTILIPTESSAATVCPRWPAPSSAAPTRKNWARPPCCRPRC